MLQTPPLQASAYSNVVQHLYVAYYGRPADPAGLSYWSAALAAGRAPTDAVAFAQAQDRIAAVSSTLEHFGNSAEAVALYGADNTDVVRAVYANLFSRLPEPEGLDFFVAALDSGAISRAGAAMMIAAGAQGRDLLSMQNKVAAATGFTAGLGTPALAAAYSGAEANVSIRTILSAVGADSDAGAATAEMLARLEALPNLTTLAMLSNLEGLIASERQVLWELLPGNPLVATQIEEKIALLSRPGLPAEIRDGAFYEQGRAASMNGSLDVSAVFPTEAMRLQARQAIREIEAMVPGLEGFMGSPFPSDAIRIWYGFRIGNAGGGGVVLTEDQATYESRPPAEKVIYEAIIAHELAHSYIGHEGLTQFLEVLAYNLAVTGSEDSRTWTYLRYCTPGLDSNSGVCALIDVYRLVGYDAMARAYGAVRLLDPPYGQPLTEACRQAFIDAAPQGVKEAVALKMALVDY